jgi:hypothetical protein
MERVPSRLAILPLVFVIAGACIAATNLLTISRRGTRAAVGAAGLFFAGGILRELGRHAMAWRMAVMEANGKFLFIDERNPLPTIVSKHDPAYVTVVLISLTLSAATFGAIIWWLWRIRRAAAELG